MQTSQDDTEMFDLAASYLKQVVGDLSSEQLLYLYARFKQVKEGPCNTSKPGFFDFQGKQKWQHWKNLGGMSKVQAKTEYIKEITRIDPDWQTKVDSSSKSSNGGIGGVVVSTMANQEEALSDNQKTVFDWCKEGNINKIAKLIKQMDVNQKDDEGMTLLHWAADRGHLSIVDCLLQNGADVNAQDADDQTALHYAASCDHSSIVKVLLKFNINISIKDSDGLTAENVSSNSDIKNLLNPVKR